MTSVNPGGNSFTVFAKLRLQKDRYNAADDGFRALWNESYLVDNKLSTCIETSFVIGSYEMVLWLMKNDIDKKYAVHAYIDEGHEVFMPVSGRFTDVVTLFDSCT